MGKHTHARYTDAEAVTAAKTVKLDDFTAPDDNIDLDASTDKHGLFPKLDHDKLDDIAAGADVTGANPPQVHGAAKHTNITREIWLPLNAGNIVAGTSAGYIYLPTVYGGANLDEPRVRVSLKVPADFVSFTSVKLVWNINAASKNMRWRIWAQYRAEGEVYNTHDDFPAYGETASSATEAADNVQEPANPLTLSSLAVGDHLGLFVEREGSHANDTIDTVAVHCIALLFTYVANQ